MTFNELGLSSRLCAALGQLGYKEPTTVQREVIPQAFQERHLFVESETGTGKTLAYLLPILQLIKADSDVAQALIVAPTRELASQISRVLAKLIKQAELPIGVGLFLGGASLPRQLETIKERPQILIGTQGRLLQLRESGHLKLDGITVAVFDEADRLLASDSRDETLALLGKISANAKLWLFSATLGKKVTALVESFVTEPLVIQTNERVVLAERMEHWCFLAEKRDMFPLIKRFNQIVKPERAIIFVRDSGQVLQTLLKLEQFEIPAAALHGDFDAEARVQALEDFKAGKVHWLVSSDVAARGLDIDDVSHIVMIDIPREPQTYIHRAGRTARNGKQGVCVTFAEAFELRYLSKIAVKLGFSFKAKRLFDQEVIDLTLEDFFAEAERMDRSFKKKKGKARR
jgi:superfamily II DNA/RNA helicase